MATPTPTESTDQRPLARALARTYGGRDGRDGWRRVAEYWHVIEYASANPEAGATAVSRATDVPRSRLRPWLESDAKPEPARAVEIADMHGWLCQDFEQPTARALSVLVAWIFSGGSIAAKNYVPLFALGDDLARTTFDRATDQLGIDYRIQRDDAAGRATEAVPADHASILGRTLVAWGAPIGPKNAAADLSLPEWLADAPEAVRLDFARTYVLNRATARADRPDLPIQITEQRAPGYRRALVRLFQHLTSAEAVVESGEHMVYLRPEAADRLYLPPLLNRTPE